MNFDVRKSLIDYDSVLSNQRELIYKQRDEILLGKNNLQIVLNMCRTVAKEITANNIDPKNGVYVLDEQVTNILNRLVFGAELINHTFFRSKPISECERHIEYLLKMSVNLKVNEIGQEQSVRIIKSMLLQNLDLQ
jgi:preprotein translocase subunit SecA